MKRFLAMLFAIVLFASCAYAEDGVYVPSYNAFMESFAGKIKDIDSDLWEAIHKDCFVDGQWIAPNNNSANRVYCFTASPELRIYEGNNFLNMLYISIPKDKLEKDEALFKDLILAVATSIVPNADAEFERTLFDNLYYDYALSSPAGYIVMYWNCGVYLFQITKMSNEIEFEVSLSVYEVE